MRQYIPLLGKAYPRTIRGKLKALVVLSVATNLGLAAYAILIAPRLAV